MTSQNATVKMNESAMKAIEEEAARALSKGRFELSCPSCGADMALVDGEGECSACGQAVRVGSVS